MANAIGITPHTPDAKELKRIPERDLAAVAEELRARILAAVAAHGGHLAGGAGRLFKSRLGQRDHGAL